MKKRLSLGIGVIVSCWLVAAAPSENISIIRLNGTEYLPLDEIIIRCGMDHSFDMISQKGRLYRKNHYAVYNVGMSVFIVNGVLYSSPVSVRRSNGRVLVPIDAGECIMKSFNPAIHFTRRDAALVCHKNYTEEKESSGNEQMLQKANRDKISFIVIDPGHGGKDPGAVGKGGIKEKDITLKAAVLLGKKIKSTIPNIRIVYTRNNDRFIELSQRTDIANRLLKKNENGLFISIHVNSSLSKKISGHETFFLSQNPTNEDARNTAALENNVTILEEKSKSRKKAYDDVDYIEAMMITTQIQKESSALASSIQKGLAANGNRFGSRGVKKADFYVLRGVLMPAALVEIGFITNKAEAQQLKKRTHLELIADGIADGIIIFIKKYNRLIHVK